jgi:hypothetical protein
MLVYERGVDGRFSEAPREVSGRDAILTVNGRSFTLALRFADIYRGIA